MNVGPFTIKIINGDGITRPVKPEKEKAVQEQMDRVFSVANAIEEFGDDFFDP